jgi:hypothetical protein
MDSYKPGVGVYLRAIFPLDLAFDSISLRSICENEEVAIGEFGRTVAETLKHRLSDFRAATTVNDLLAGNPREVSDGGGNLIMVVDLSNNYQMLFSMNHPRNTMVNNGKVDWQKVSRVKILQIGRNLC